MVDRVLVRPAAAPVVRRRRRPLLTLLAAFIALTAYGGGLGLITGFLNAGPTVTARLPLASPVVGGLALVAVVAVPNSVLGVLAGLGSRWAPAWALLAGALLVSWIVVELLFIRTVSFFHPTYLLLGLLLCWLGRSALPVDRWRPGG